VSDNGKPPERYGRGQHPNSRAQLKPGAGRWKPGQPSPNLRSGLYSENPGPLILNGYAKEIEAALGDVVPRGPDGEPLPQFAAALQVVALMALQIERCRNFLAGHGDTDERGRWRPENDALDKKLASYLNALDRMGATPAAYGRLGLNIAQVEDLALRRARDLEEADRDLEEESP